MSRIKYCLVPGWVVSRSDRDHHYIGVVRLIQLYNVPRGSYVQHSIFQRGRCQNLTHLGPRYDGSYYDVQALPEPRG